MVHQFVRKEVQWLVFALVAMNTSLTANAATLLIEVKGLRSGKGDVHFAVYNKPNHFPTRNGKVAYGNVPAKAEGVVIPVKGLEKGTYAIAVFHDENRNDEFDQGLLGIPLEDYGFSNNATGFLGPPSFKDAAVKLQADWVRTVIRLD
ncbi:MAG: hypothetical protein CMM52_12880 [Rhodospirillaceae bacterium]|nr:hypothetical protein [Rhodospirillaceae bacterium]